MSQQINPNNAPLQFLRKHHLEAFLDFVTLEYFCEGEWVAFHLRNEKTKLWELHAFRKDWTPVSNYQDGYSQNHYKKTTRDKMISEWVEETLKGYENGYISPQERLKREQDRIYTYASPPRDRGRDGQ